MLPVRVGHDWAGPTPDPSWQAALDEIAPRTPYGHDWLYLRWEPGEPWEPVERWIIWSMTPIWRVPALGIREALEGPNPRNFGHWDDVLGRFVRTRYLPISRQQWEIYRETGCFARPLWVIQGAHGGHLRRFTDVQAAISEMHGGPDAPPAPGDLPYADFDRRVVEKLRHLDVVERFGDVLGAAMSDAAVAASLDRREREIAREMAEQMWGWLGSQVEAALDPGEGDGLTRAQAEAVWERADPDAPVLDEDEEREQFMDTIVHAY